MEHRVEEARSRLLALTARGEVGDAELHEWALQLLLFDGYPLSIAALGLLEECLPEKRWRVQSRAPAGRGPFRARGQALFEAVYGAVAAKALAALARRSRTLHDWILEHGYGQVLSRPGLQGAWREGLAVFLLARKGWRVQLRAHLRGALRLGLGVKSLQALLELANPPGELLKDAKKWLQGSAPWPES